MSWFAAHLVMYVKLKAQPQERFPLWENVVLLKAGSEEEAFARAEERGRADAIDDGSFRWGGQPAQWVFAGVRKLTVCQDGGKRPGDGTEVSFLEMEVASLDVIDKLMAGKPAAVKLTDKFHAPALDGAKANP